MFCRSLLVAALNSKTLQNLSNGQLHGQLYCNLYPSTVIEANTEKLQDYKTSTTLTAQMHFYITRYITDELKQRIAAQE